MRVSRKSETRLFRTLALFIGNLKKNVNPHTPKADIKRFVWTLPRETGDFITRARLWQKGGFTPLNSNLPRVSKRHVLGIEGGR